MRRDVFVSIGVAAVLGLAAGCGSSGSSEGTLQTTTITPAAAFADGLCSAASTYKDSVKSVTSTLKGSNPTKGDVKSALSDLNTATQKLVSDLKGLEPPSTADGTKARQTVSDLATALRQDLAAIKSAVESISSAAGAPIAAATVASTIGAAQNEIAAAVAQLQALDPKSQLQQAFQSSGACKSLSSSSG